IPIDRMKRRLTYNATSIGQSTRPSINRAPSLGRACEPCQQRCFAVTLQINRQRKSFSPECAQKREGLAHYGRHTPTMKGGSIDRNDVFHIRKSLDQWPVLFRR